MKTHPSSIPSTSGATDGDVLTVQADGTRAWEAVPNQGDVDGPASSTDNALARFDSTTGKLLQNGVVTSSDTGAIAGAIGLLLDEQADHPTTPAAGKGEFWVANTAGSPQMYTNDAGADAIVAAPTVLAIGASDIDFRGGNTQTRAVSGSVTFTASNATIGAEVFLTLTVSSTPAEPTWPTTTTKIGTGTWSTTATNYVVIRCTNTVGPTFVRTIAQVSA